jgi:RNA 3'-terminal phosphate cyclase (GTP)
MSVGSGVVLWAIFSKDRDEIDVFNPIRIGADSLGEKGKKSEVVGTEAALGLVEEIGFKAPVDQYLADNLIPWLGLFGGKMKVSKVTNHTLSNIYVVEKFLGKVFDVDKENKIISVV